MPTYRSNENQQSDGHVQSHLPLLRLIRLRRRSRVVLYIIDQSGSQFRYVAQILLLCFLDANCEGSLAIIHVLVQEQEANVVAIDCDELVTCVISGNERLTQKQDDSNLPAAHQSYNPTIHSSKSLTGWLICKIWVPSFGSELLKDASRFCVFKISAIALWYAPGKTTAKTQSVRSDALSCDEL